MPYNYNETQPAPRYRYLTEQMRDVFGRILDLKNVDMKFISETWDGAPTYVAVASYATTANKTEQLRNS